MDQLPTMDESSRVPSRSAPPGRRPADPQRAAVGGDADRGGDPRPRDLLLVLLQVKRTAAAMLERAEELAERQGRRAPPRSTTSNT